ncbi:MAG: polysaccharide deacetylase family protein, partial [Betaproteobacteria bacterium]|nr:polysaccharide deacetylase family protein [Betaproteobacteria bacterium]
AFPILKRTGVPATIFLSTGYISGVRTFWYDWLCYLCNQPSVRRSGISFAGRQFPLGENFRLRRENIAVLFAHVKRLPDDLLRQEIAKLESAMGVEYPQEGFDESHPLTWDQVREMSEAGIEFGSHAVTHPILTNLTDEQLHQELLVSKQKIEQEISKPVDVIAYPVGEAFAFSDKVIGAAKSVGYRLGASYLSGVNEQKLPNQFELRRLHVERYTSRSDFQGMLAMPGLLA